MCKLADSIPHGVVAAAKRVAPLIASKKVRLKVLGRSTVHGTKLHADGEQHQQMESSPGCVAP